MCGRVAVINDGRLVKQAAPRNFAGSLAALRPNGTQTAQGSTAFFAQRSEAASFAAELDSAAFIRRTNLEDVFIELTGRAIK